VDAAYALDSTVQELIWIAGPLLLAVLLAVGGRQLPLVACGVLSVAGTVVYTLRLRAAPDVPGTRATATSPLRQARVRAAASPGRESWWRSGVRGSLAGGLAYGSRSWKSPVERRAMICLAAFGAMLMLLAAAPDLIILALLMVGLGQHGGRCSPHRQKYCSLPARSPPKPHAMNRLGGCGPGSEAAQ